MRTVDRHDQLLRLLRRRADWTVADLARETGTARLQVWLLEPDTVSAGFFESAGWAPDGWARTLDTGAGPLREVRWHAMLLDDDGLPDGGDDT